MYKNIILNEVRSAATRANKQEAMTVAERQFGANLKLGATFGSANFDHVLFYRASKGFLAGILRPAKASGAQKARCARNGQEDAGLKPGATLKTKSRSLARTPSRAGARTRVPLDRDDNEGGFAQYCHTQRMRVKTQRDSSRTEVRSGAQTARPAVRSE